MSKTQDIQQEVTQKIIAQLEQGTAPWEKPWRTIRARGAANRGNPLPHNANSGGVYSGINFLLLSMEQNVMGYTSAGWLTFKQALDLGGNVKKGEKSTRILRYVQGKREIENEAGEIEERGYSTLRVYSVFNVEQCENLPERITAPNYQQTEKEKQTMREGVAGIINSHNVNLAYGADRAAYYPSTDKILMPYQADFISADHHDSTLLHELTHWTGAQHRLARKIGNAKGSPDYAYEELIAELGAAQCCAVLGIDANLNHAAYIESWLKCLKEDKTFIFKAASAARKACEYLTTTPQAKALAA